MLNLNKVARHKSRDQAQFRVHFYIKHVYFDSSLPPNQFLQAISAKLSKIAPIAHLQIIAPIKRLVDISVGILSDLSAYNFMESGRRIHLPTEIGSVVEHEIIISDSFRTYFRAMKEGRLSREESKGRDKESSESSVELERRRERSQRKKQEEYRKREEEEDIKVYYLWIFCIPFDCKEREVCNSLAEKNIRVKSSDWKLKEDMEYLQVELMEPVGVKDLEGFDCRVDKCPLLVLPRLQDQNNVYQHILKHEIELNFEKDIEELQLIRLADKIGGVLLLIKDEYYGPRKYVVAFNSALKIDILIEEVKKRYKHCQCERPKYPVRLCRVERTFTFTQIVENLVAYQEEM